MMSKSEQALWRPCRLQGLSKEDHTCSPDLPPCEAELSQGCEQTLGRTVMRHSNRNREKKETNFFFFFWNGKSLLMDIDHVALYTEHRRERKYIRALVSFNIKWQTYLLLSVLLASYFALMYMHSCCFWPKRLCIQPISLCFLKGFFSIVVIRQAFKVISLVRNTCCYSWWDNFTGKLILYCKTV